MPEKYMFSILVFFLFSFNKYFIHLGCVDFRSDLALVYMYLYRIQDTTDLKLKVNQKHNTTTGNAMLICTLSTDLQISMGE